jgi:hypothetical protein
MSAATSPEYSVRDEVCDVYFHHKQLGLRWATQDQGQSMTIKKYHGLSYSVTISLKTSRGVICNAQYMMKFEIVTCTGL